MSVDVERIRSHLDRLARLPRPAESDELVRARGYVTLHLQAAGWEISPHAFRAETEEGLSLCGVNLVARHCEHPLSYGPRLCIGAHLDSRPDSPGADDNASAVATLLELARLLPGRWPAEPRLELELVAFDLEENGMLGGCEHAQRTAGENVDLKGMVSLEMLGYCDDSPQSQALPRSLVGLYPDTGNFIAVIGNQNSQVLLDRFAGGMRIVRGLNVETLVVPSNGEFLQATRLSDHSPFWDAGYPALMITDTSFLRNPHYHQPSDTLDTLDMQFLGRVANGCVEAVVRLLAEGL